MAANEPERRRRAAGQDRVVAEPLVEHARHNVCRRVCKDGPQRASHERCCEIRGQQKGRTRHVRQGRERRVRLSPRRARRREGRRRGLQRSHENARRAREVAEGDLGGPPRCGRRRSSTYAPTWSAARWSLAIVLALSACHPSPRTNPPSAHVQSSLLALRRDVDSILAAPALRRTSWGVLVRSLTTNETLYNLSADKLLMPASALKIVTLAAAAERLGWSHTYETRVVTDGTVRGDTLDGNVVIVGSGDPSLDRPALESWTDQLKALGIAKVTGSVRADPRAFAGAALGFGWSWDDVPYYYAAPVAAAQFHENAVDVRLTPGSVPGSPVAWELAPPGSGLSVTKRMTTGAAAAATEFVARRAPGSSSVVLEGVVPVGSAPIVQGLSVDDPPRYLAAAFAAVLVAKSITVGNRESSIAP